jgi:hypothetical protein
MSQTPKLIMELSRGFEAGYKSPATNVIYNYVKKSPEEISQIIRETWNYIKEQNKSTHILSHFIYLLQSEVKREWIKDISYEILEYTLKSEDDEVVDNSIQLIESWEGKDLLDLLYSTDITTIWLNKYKMDVLVQYKYFEQERVK